jgi:hypothetical protein
VCRIPHKNLEHGVSGKVPASHSGRTQFLHHFLPRSDLSPAGNMETRVASDRYHEHPVRRLTMTTVCMASDAQNLRNTLFVSAILVLARQLLF